MDGKTMSQFFVLPLSLCCRSCRCRVPAAHCSLRCWHPQCAQELPSLSKVQASRRTYCSHSYFWKQQTPPQIFSEKQHFVCTQFNTSLCFHTILYLIQSYTFIRFSISSNNNRFHQFHHSLTFDETHNIHKHALHTHTRVRICRCVWTEKLCMGGVCAVQLFMKTHQHIFSLTFTVYLPHFY